MSAKSKVDAERNRYNNTWDVGWRHADGEFTPYLCGYRTKKAAAAEIPGFNQRVESDLKALMEEKDVEEHEQAERFPNLGYVRAKIKELRDSGTAEDWAASFDASGKLEQLLDMDLHEHIGWPLPSWKAIKSRRVYG